uniref:Ecdysteroid kinase n=1 Tax=Candidatus Kentrum sp. SD TaxID=2126332 RepID=A0A450YAD6_9GAMM|nr:MAG: Ecdysteroid kinase [Candidatus Kentron sp. SD]VFK43464.1 MAG: Ecdysteroid kinase [Candidatus Kentron sp. SD]VFK80636.1 MAG: Ecdysteroid kinase [Candidatus Kentron sp. SD]
MSKISGSSEDFKVNFEFRFNPDQNQHDIELGKRVGLINKFAKQEKRSFPGVVEFIRLYPVVRAGKSGSEVFYLDIFVKNINFPKRYIAKFQNVNATIEEGEAAKNASFASICGNVSNVSDRNIDLGILVYDLAKISDHIEFRAYFLDKNYSDENCGLALTSVYKQIGQHPNEKTDPKSFLQDYDCYLNRRSQPLRRIKSFINCNQRYKGISDLAEAINHHYMKIVNKLENCLVFPYLVHGDLHARNLMLSVADPTKTELIDFAWVHYGHPAKDFSLMEATLKYMLLYEFFQKIDRPDNCNLHMPVVAFERFEQYLCEHIFELPEINDFENHMRKTDGILDHHIIGLRRTYVSLMALRNSAKQILDAYCAEHDRTSGLTSEKHFLISNFLITFGLSGFPEVQPIWVLIGLDIIGNSIHQR